MTHRFKIDFNPDSTYVPVIICFSRKTFFGERWEKIGSFDSIDKAREHYEKIKDLPEYLP